MELIDFAAAHGTIFKILGVLLCLVSIVLFIAFPVRHRDTTLLGDGGIGLFAASLRQNGIARTLLVYAPGAIGAGLYFLPMLAVPA